MSTCHRSEGQAVWLLKRGALPGGVQLERTALDNATQADTVDGDGQLDADEFSHEAAVRREMAATSEVEDEAVVRYRHVMELQWSARGSKREAGSVVCDCVRLVSVSVPLRALFFQYRVALSYLQRHYNARQLLLSLLRGQRLPTAPPSSAALAVFAMSVGNNLRRKQQANNNSIQVDTVIRGAVTLDCIVRQAAGRTD